MLLSLLSLLLCIYCTYGQNNVVCHPTEVQLGADGTGVPHKGRMSTAPGMISKRLISPPSFSCQDLGVRTVQITTTYLASNNKNRTQPCEATVHVLDTVHHCAAAPPAPYIGRPGAYGYYEGCYKDLASDPAIPHIEPIAGDLTIGKCIEACQQKNFNFAAVQGGTQCRCSNGTHAKHGPASNSTCCKACRGNQFQSCGGQIENAVFRIKGVCAAGTSCCGDTTGGFGCNHVRPLPQPCDAPKPPEASPPAFEPEEPSESEERSYENEDTGLSAGAVAGIVIGCAVGGCVYCICFGFCVGMCESRKKRQHPYGAGNPGYLPQPPPPLAPVAGIPLATGMDVGSTPPPTPYGSATDTPPFEEDFSAPIVKEPVPEEWEHREFDVAHPHAYDLVEIPKGVSSTSNVDQLSMDTPEALTLWRKIQTMVDQSGQGCNCCGWRKEKHVIKIERVENITVWEAYQQRKLTMRRSHALLHQQDPQTKLRAIWPPMKTESKDTTRPYTNEYWAFHGTSHEKLQLILSGGFDDRVAASTGLYGTGCYFSDQSCKALQYSPQHEQHRYLLLCRVLLGHAFYTTRECTGWKRPPALTQDGTHLYDSLVANPNYANNGRQKHREIVVYHSDQCYPEYLVTFGTSEEVPLSPVTSGPVLTFDESAVTNGPPRVNPEASYSVFPPPPAPVPIVPFEGGEAPSNTMAPVVLPPPPPLVPTNAVGTPGAF
eukprot:TRINITY_DN38186_c0_g1_i1.p1 TRINITY_DN38186_c0_g1~~TRINITY_DN38186_c0_g1_i1.p1  ORF type:complete len:714 (-),score=26.85 TRINITY_DN38186_c0_g1_i1:202-2343(-)